MNLTKEYREDVQEALLLGRNNYSGSDAAYAKKFDISASVFSRIKKGETENILSDGKWLFIGSEFNVGFNDKNWNIARTDVYNEIESNLKFCKEFNKSMILVDVCGIGKTACTKNIISNLEDAFYLDCSQAKNKISFTRALAKAIGLDDKGRYVDVKNTIKYYLKLLHNPIIAIDDAGDLEYPAFLDLKEYWNATENFCGWYMIGDDSLREKIDKGLNKKKVGYAAIFSRFSEEFISLTPINPRRKQDFLVKLIGDVASINLEDQSKVPVLTQKCIGKEKTLRHLRTLIQIGRM